MQKLFFGELNSNYIIWKWTLNPWGKTLISSQESHLEKMVDCKCYLDLVGLSPNLLKLGPGSIGKKKEVSQATEPRGPTGNPRCPPLRSLRVKVSHAMSSPQKCFNVCVIFMLMFKCLKCILQPWKRKCGLTSQNSIVIWRPALPAHVGLSCSFSACVIVMRASCIFLTLQGR